jgi:hypothetical protein
MTNKNIDDGNATHYFQKSFQWKILFLLHLAHNMLLVADGHYKCYGLSQYNEKYINCLLHSTGVKLKHLFQITLIP